MLTHGFIKFNPWSFGLMSKGQQITMAADSMAEDNWSYDQGHEEKEKC